MKEFCEASVINFNDHLRSEKAAFVPHRKYLGGFELLVRPGEKVEDPQN